MDEVKVREGEPRLEYLARVLYYYMQRNGNGDDTIIYDEAECDGYCLAQDFLDELWVVMLERR